MRSCCVAIEVAAVSRGWPLRDHCINVVESNFCRPEPYFCGKILFILTGLFRLICLSYFKLMFWMSAKVRLYLMLFFSHSSAVVILLLLFVVRIATRSIALINSTPSTIPWVKAGCGKSSSKLTTTLLANTLLTSSRLVSLK